MKQKISRYAVAARCLILATSLVAAGAEAASGRLVSGNGITRFVGNNENGRLAITRLTGEDSPLLVTRFIRGDGNSDAGTTLSLVRLTRIVEFNGDPRNPRDFHNYGGNSSGSSSLSGLGAADAGMQ